MTNAEAKAKFNKMIAEMRAAQVDAETIAKVEIIREWTTNAQFRNSLSDYTFHSTMNAVVGPLIAK